MSRLEGLEDYINTAEAAKILGLHIKTVARLVREGKLSGVKVARDWLIERESVEAYKAATEGKSKHDPTRKFAGQDSDGDSDEE